MMIELNTGNILVIAGLSVGAIWALVKIIAMQQTKELERRFASLGVSIDGVRLGIAEEAKTTARLERDLLTYQGLLPLHYVRREDFVREVATIGTKIDNMALRVEHALGRRQLPSLGEKA